MRTVFPIAALLVLSLNVGTLRAASSDSSMPDQQSIEARSRPAPIRRSHASSASSIRAGGSADDPELSDPPIPSRRGWSRRRGLLQQIQRIVKKIHLSVGDDDKRLKNAELMLSHTAFRLGEMLRASSLEDRPLVEQTLSQVTDAKNATLMQVFRK